MVGSAAILAALVVSRRPDVLSTPQFWAEDGRLWYQDAANRGICEATLTPAAGYFQTFARLVAALAQPLGLAHAPLAFAIAALVVQVAPPALVLSGRYDETIPSPTARLLLALFLVGAPNGAEVHVNVTNAQTHLAILSALIVVADPAPTRGWRTFDLLALVLSSLAGPTGVLLVPIAGLACVWRRTRHQRLLLLALLAPASIQLVTFLVTRGARSDAPLGATPVKLLELVGGQILLAGTLGAEAYAQVYAWEDPHRAWLTRGTGVLALALVTRVLLAGPIPLRLFTLFAAAVLAVALWSPVLVAPVMWDALIVPHTGTRYFALPIVAFLACLLWLALGDSRRGFRIVARTNLALVLVLGIPAGWLLPARADLEFHRHVARYRDAPRGALVRIPILPEGWEMRLLKR